MYRTIRHIFRGFVIIALGLLSLLAFTVSPADAVNCNAGLSLGAASSTPAVPATGPVTVTVHQVINNTALNTCRVELVVSLPMKYLPSGLAYPEQNAQVIDVPPGGGSFDAVYDVPLNYELLLPTVGHVSLLRDFTPACPALPGTC
jgi:hypothetical protein